jgi:hypothetical protein
MYWLDKIKEREQLEKQGTDPRKMRFIKFDAAGSRFDCLSDPRVGPAVVRAAMNVIAQ